MIYLWATLLLAVNAVWVLLTLQLPREELGGRLTVHLQDGQFLRIGPTDATLGGADRGDLDRTFLFGGSPLDAQGWSATFTTIL